jgi:hypothetical protein
LRGIGRSGQKFVLVLDIDKVLGSDDPSAEPRVNSSLEKVAGGKSLLKESHSNHEVDSA